MAKLKGSRPGSLGELYDVLEAAFPDLRTDKGELKVYALADHLGCKPQVCYKWFEKDKLTPERAQDIVKKSNGRLTLKKLERFVFK